MKTEKRLLAESMNDNETNEAFDKLDREIERVELEMKAKENKRATSKSATIKGLKTTIKNLKACELMWAQEEEVLENIYKRIIKEWIETM